jgi:hypothetical protein
MTVTVTFPSRDHLKAQPNGSLKGLLVDRELASPIILDPTKATPNGTTSRQPQEEVEVQWPWALSAVSLDPRPDIMHP